MGKKYHSSNISRGVSNESVKWCCLHGSNKAIEFNQKSKFSINPFGEQCYVIDFIKSLNFQ
jgi:hypothetical protein